VRGYFSRMLISSRLSCPLNIHTNIVWPEHKSKTQEPNGKNICGRHRKITSQGNDMGESSTSFRLYIKFELVDRDFKIRSRVPALTPRRNMPKPHAAPPKPLQEAGPEKGAQESRSGKRQG
jgi:hypothetical protein